MNQQTRKQLIRERMRDNDETHRVAKHMVDALDRQHKTQLRTVVKDETPNN